MAVQVLSGPAGLTDQSGRLLTTDEPSDPASATAVANTAVVTTYAASGGVRHRLTFLAFSYSAAPVGARVTVVDGASTVLDIDYLTVQNGNVPLPPGGLEGTVNTTMTVTLAAGGAGVIGKLNTAKFTVG